MLEFHSWFPKSSKEKREYNKIKKGWQEINKDSENSKNNNHRISPLIVIIPTILIIFTVVIHNSDSIVAIYEKAEGKVNISKHVSTTAQKTATAITKNISVNKSGVSLKTDKYIQKCVVINKEISEWQKNAYEDFTKYGSVQFKYYKDSTTQIINDINTLETMEVPKGSRLNNFFEYTSSYYSQLKEYFQNTLNNESLTAESYNSLNEWQRNNESMTENFRKNLDNAKIDYTMETTSEGESVRYQVNQNSID